MKNNHHHSNKFRFLLRRIQFTVILAGSFLFSQGLRAQTFQNVVFGNGTASDDYVAGMVVYDSGNPALVDGYIAVGNTNSYAIGVQQNIWVTRFDVNGNIVWSRSIAHADLDDFILQASDVQAASKNFVDNMYFPDYGGNIVKIFGGEGTSCTNKSDFYISGYYIKKGGNLRKMLLIKLDYQANVIWTLTDFANFTRRDYDEAAVSVEVSERDGDVFVVGSASRGVLNKHFIAARVNMNGRLLWCNRYFADDPCFSQNFELMPRQSCLYKDIYGHTGIAVIGGTHYPLAKIIDYAFVSRINSDGTEAWRMSSYSPNSPDGDLIMGNDIILARDSINYLFAATGTLTRNAIGKTFIYNFKVNASGNQTMGQLIGHSQHSLSGQSIRTDGSGAGPEYVITGRYTKNPDQYVLLLKTQMNAAPAWSWIYTSYLRSNVKGTEKGYPNGDGYFIATNTDYPFGNTSSGHVLATNINGKIVPDACAHTPVTLKQDSLGEGILLWTVVVPEPFARQAKTFGKSFPPKDELCTEPALRTTAKAHAANGGLTLFPNPASQSLNVVMQSSTAGQAQLGLYGIDGHLVETRTMNLVAGKNTLNWNISRLKAGNYMLKATQQNGQSLQQHWVKE